jgi:hypothetical protein
MSAIQRAIQVGTIQVAVVEDDARPWPEFPRSRPTS